MRGARARMDDKLKMTPHTAAKHSILRRYLDCWFPILGHAGSVAYVDGFAGPGRYPTGEEGSPIIALNAARDKIEHLKSGAQFWFVENDPDAATTLQGEIGRIRANLPGGLRVHDVVREDFEVGFKDIVSKLRTDRGMTPTFAFVDPFGYSDTAMKTFVDFLANPHCEIFFTFMAPSVARFTKLQKDNHLETLNALFGSSAWKECDDRDGRRKIRCLVETYSEQLSRDVEYVKIFEMLDENQYPKYSLVFATNHIKGLKVMKDAMYAVARDFSFSFSDARHPNQRGLFPSDENDDWIADAAAELHANFRGQTVPIQSVKEHVIADTRYRFRNPILHALEDADPPKITVSRSGGKRRPSTYPDGCSIAFAP